MQDGWIKTAAAAPSIRVADCAYNAQQIIACIKRAEQAQVQLLVLPELCMTGYTCGDLFLQPTLLEGAREGLRMVCEKSKTTELLCVLGVPVAHAGKLYNCAAVIQKGKVLGLVPKTHLPNYNEFYEKRHFEPAPVQNSTVQWGEECIPFGSRLLFRCQTMPDFCLGVEVCEDVWVPQAPSVMHTAAGATVIANVSASDETIGKAEYRRALIAMQSARLVCGYVYADAGEGESTTDMVFAGHHIIAENGAVLAQSAPFSGQMAMSEIDVSRLAGERRRMTTFPAARPDGYEEIAFSMVQRPTALTRAVPKQPFVPSGQADRAGRCESILRMQSMGLKKRLEHSHSQTAVVGISGGLDSCLALLVMVRAMDALKRPRTDIVAVTMPCFGTTERTRSNAEVLCQRLGVTLRCIDIGQAVQAHFADIGHAMDDHNVVFENSQARERTQVLMDIANQTGGLVVGTGDLSELALGWATYNGDHMSMYGVNASVPKTLVRHIVRYEAGRTEDAALREVLLDILDTPVSPELLPAQEDGQIAQKTEDLVGPYELHDFFLYYAIRWAFRPQKVFRLACYAFAGDYERRTILFWLKTFYRRFFNQQFKRSCLPDGPKVGSVTLSPRGDWRMPSDASAALWQAELDAIQIEEA